MHIILKRKFVMQFFDNPNAIKGI